MSDWIEVKLGDICEFISRGITPNYSDDGILVLNQKCIRDNRVNSALGRFTAVDTKINSSKLLKSGDILINSTGTGTLGRVSIYKGATNCVTVDSHVTILRMKEGVSPVYLGYFLHSIVPLIENLGRGSTNQKELSTGDLKRIRIVLPDITNQSKVAEQLSVFDSMIDNNSGRIELLEQAAQELYKEWFVRFRFPGYENAKFEDGIPEGWSYVRLEKAIDIIDGDRGVNYPKQEEFYPEGDCLFLNAGNVTSKGFNFSACSYITKEKDSILRKGKLQHGDVILTTRGTVGNAAFYNETMTFSEMRINSGMVILRNLGVVSPEYIYSALRHEYLQKLMTLYASGSAQPQLPIKDMKRMKIIKPGTKTMERFTEMSADIYNQISLLIMKNQALAKQRDMLLPRLMSGKVEVN